MLDPGLHTEVDDSGALLTVDELADYLQVPTKTIYAWRHKNCGPPGFRVEAWHTSAGTRSTTRSGKCATSTRGSRERSKTFRRKVDAEKFLIQVESQKQRGEWIDPDLAATPFADWAHSWITTRPHLKPKTLDGYQSLLRIHIVPRFGGVRLDRIDGLSIEQWIADMQGAGLSASRIRQAHRVLSQILRPAVRARYLPANPADGIPLSSQAPTRAVVPEPGRGRSAGRRRRPENTGL